MMKLSKASNRDKKINKKKYGHRVGSRSVFDILRIHNERAKTLRLKKEKEQRILKELGFFDEL